MTIKKVVVKKTVKPTVKKVVLQKKLCPANDSNYETSSKSQTEPRDPRGANSGVNQPTAKRKSSPTSYKPVRRLIEQPSQSLKRSFACSGSHSTSDCLSKVYALAALCAHLADSKGNIKINGQSLNIRTDL